MNRWVLYLAAFFLSLPTQVLAQRIVFKGAITVDKLESNGVTLGSNAGKLKIDYALEQWSILGALVVKCHAKWSFDNTFSDVTINTNYGEFNMPQSEFLNSFRPYNLKILVPVSREAYALCDPGVLASKPKKMSFDIPGSPEWNKAFFIRSNSDTKNEDYETHASADNLGIAGFDWLAEGSSRQLVRDMREYAKSTLNKTVLPFNYKLDWDYVDYDKNKDVYVIREYNTLEQHSISFYLEGVHKGLQKEELKKQDEKTKESVSSSAIKDSSFDGVDSIFEDYASREDMKHMDEKWLLTKWDEENYQRFIQFQKNKRQQINNKDVKTAKPYSYSEVFEWDFTDPLTGVSIVVREIHLEPHPGYDDYVDITILFPEKVISDDLETFLLEFNYKTGEWRGAHYISSEDYKKLSVEEVTSDDYWIYEFEGKKYKLTLNTVDWLEKNIEMTVEGI